MAVMLQHTPIMPIDTLFSMSSSPPISYYMSNAKSAYLYQRSTTPYNTTDVPSHSMHSGPGLREVNWQSSNFFTSSHKLQVYNPNKLRASKNMQKVIQPLRSCLRVKIEQNGGNESSSNSSETSTIHDGDLNRCTAELENQMDKIQISKQISPGNSPKEKKTVVFADTKGLALENIKILASPSDMPPFLSQDLLKRITQDVKPEPNHPYNYVTDFEQPASNYLEFRECLEHKFVSLENVLIRENIKVIGTIKVKNIAFEKIVLLRVSYDNWRTYTDVAATYIPQSNVSSSRYDSFSFDFDILPNHCGKKFEFCIKYETCGESYWDNNQGRNYCIVAQERRVMTENQKILSYYSSLNGQHNWGDFSYWKCGEDEGPYW